MPKKQKTTYEFEVGVYEDHGITALILEQGEWGGYRLTPSKATGRWDHKRTFRCSIDIDQLRIADEAYTIKKQEHERATKQAWLDQEAKAAANAARKARKEAREKQKAAQ